MDIHHAMMVHNKPDKLYEAITQHSDLEVWMGAPTLAKPEVGSIIEFQYDQGQRAENGSHPPRNGETSPVAFDPSGLAGRRG